MNMTFPFVYFQERSHKDAVALHREIKAFRALLLRRSHVNGAIPSGGLLNTGIVSLHSKNVVSLLNPYALMDSSF